MNRAFSKIFIVFLVLILIFIGAVFYVYQQREKAIEEMSKKFTPEELLKMAGEQAKSNLESGCPQVVNEYKNESRCQSLLKTEYRDACYYCFASEKQDSSICEKITDGNILKSCKEQISQSAPAAEEKAGQVEDAKKKARDLSREFDMRQIVIAQEMYYNENNTYLTSAIWPSKIGFFMSETPTDPGNGAYIWLNNTGNGQKYCAYAVLEEGGWFAASQRGSFKCSDNIPTLDDCCF